MILYPDKLSEYKKNITQFGLNLKVF